MGKVTQVNPIDADVAAMGKSTVLGLGHVHLVVLICALLITVMAWKFAETQLGHQSQEHFERSMIQTVDVLVERMEKYDEALRAGVAVLRMAENDVSSAQWRLFSQNLRLPERYPGINGIGLIYQVPAEGLQDFVAEQQLQQPEFQVVNASDGTEHFVITYIEPLEANREALGLDIGFEENRRHALLRAATTGQTTMTGPIVLVQDETATAGFLLLAPFYGDVPGRPPVFLGAAYAPFVTHRLIDGVLGQSRRNTMMQISDGTQIIYNEIEETDPEFDPDPVHSDSLTLPMFGRDWRVTFQSNLAFRRAHGANQPKIILICGLIVDASLFAIFVSLSRTKARAHEYAQELTCALRAEKHELEASNAALERYARISSHDLRTPLRAMRDLTDYLTEDLAETHPKASEDARFRTNVSQMNGMIDRMDRLIAGMLTYSQLGQTGRQPETFKALGEVTQALSGIENADSSCSLHGEFPILHCDRSLFRTIVSNLIKNAIQHHPDIKAAQIQIRGKVSGTSFVLSVQDNGCGIDPRYHDRIFDMFQTLHCNGLTHHTGLGLAFVKRAATLIGGHVTVQSQANEGSVFTVMLHGIADVQVDEERKAA